MNELTINKEFADKYDKYRKKEEFQRLKDKYGREDTGTSSDTTSDEEEDPKLEENFFKVLTKLKNKDPKIYDKNENFFQDSSTGSEKEKKEKPFLLRDYERKVILEKGGVYENEKQNEHKSYFGELEKLKKDLIEATNDEKADDDFLKVKEKSLSERNLLEIRVEELDEYWKDPELNKDEKYLRDYLLGEKYKEELEDEDSNNGDESDNENNENNELFVMKQEKFEHKFNFRFQEPDAEFVKSYPRTIGNSVRRESKTKRKRLERRERREQEKKKKGEEIKRLKQLKREEILNKMTKLQEASGNPEIKFNEKDLEKDFDSNEYDKRMKDLFDAEFYSKEEIEKPVFSDIDNDFVEESDDWDQFNCGDESEYYNGETPECEQDDFNMDCDFEPKEKKKTKNFEKKTKKKSAFYEAVAKKKPIFNPDEKSFEEFLDEYYALDYEDLVGGIPCRFKYKKVPANDFGLTTEEILASDNQTLNSWCSLKHVVEQRSEIDEKYWIRKFKSKSRIKKRKHFAHLNKPATSETSSDQKVVRKKLNSRQRRRKKEREDRLRALSDDITNNVSMMSSNNNEKSIKLKRLSKLNESRLEAYGIKPKKLVKKIKYG